MSQAGIINIAGGGGGGSPIEAVNLQTGTTPIVPTTNMITLTGAVVAAGTNPVRTDGTGVSTGAVEVQISQAIAATDATKIGLANFNSAQFTVDANGFVSIVGGAAIDTINGDSGSISGSTVTIYSNNAAINAGQTVKFVNSGTTSTFNVTDANQNTIIGQGSGRLASTQSFNTIIGYLAGAALTTGQGGNNLYGWKSGNAITTGDNNTGQGQSSFQFLTTGVQNVGMGNNALSAITSGSYNTSHGHGAGSSLTGSDSSNLILENDGTAGDTHTIRIGRQGSGNAQHNKCFVAGIIGVTASNTQYVTINSSTGQLGVATYAPVYAYTATAISYQVLITDKIIGVTSNAAARTITMPNAGMVAGQSWTIKDEAGTAQSSNNITISGNGANIDGAATFVINTNYGSPTIYWNGTNFFII